MRVLFVDLSGIVGSNPESVLCDAGFSVDRVSSMPDVGAIELSERYVILVFDFGNSIIRGAHLIASLRRQGAITPIVTLASRDISSDKVALLDAGADDCLAKPLDSFEFVSRCHALIRRSRLTALHSIRG